MTSAVEVLGNERTSAETAVGTASVFGRILATSADPAPFVLRVVLGAILFPHGAQHVFGWFGGYGFAGTHEWMTATLGIPSALATLALVTELVAPLALVAGLGGRIAALAIAGFMAVAASTHVEHGFFMNWFGTLPAGAEGYEFHLLAIAIAVAVAIRGSGAWSVDRLLARQTDCAIRILDPARHPDVPS